MNLGWLDPKRTKKLKLSRPQEATVYTHTSIHWCTYNKLGINCILSNIQSEANNIVPLPSNNSIYINNQSSRDEYPTEMYFLRRHVLNSKVDSNIAFCWLTWHSTECLNLFYLMVDVDQTILVKNQVCKKSFASNRIAWAIELQPRFRKVVAIVQYRNCF